MKKLDRRWKVLLVTGVAVFMAFLDVTIVNVAFPSIHAAFPSVSVAELSWVLNAYNIVFAALLGPGGSGRGPARAAADVLRRASRCSSLPRRSVGSRRRSRWLVAARVVQAIGAASLVPTSLGLLLPEFPLERRASATALWGAVGGVAAATGPSLGGLLIEWSGWRVVFFVNLALGAAVWVPARRLLRETRDPDRGAVPDALGVGLLAIGVGACRWRSSRRPRGAGRARGCSARSRCRRAAARVVRAALDDARAPRAGAVPVPRALVRRGVHGRVHVRAGLLRGAAGQHPLPDRDVGLHARCTPASR